MYLNTNAHHHFNANLFLLLFYLLIYEYFATVLLALYGERPRGQKFTTKLREADRPETK